MNRLDYRYWLCVLMLSGLFSPVSAQSTPNKLTIQDIFNLETVSDPQISPDGNRIVYVRQFADIMNDKRRSNIWIINFDGTDHRPLTTGNFNDTSPRWSPDGNQIIYISNRDQTPESPPQIYRRWMDTGESAKLTNLTEAPAGIALSPDGKWISFTMRVPDAPASIIKMPTPPEGAKWAEPAKVIDKLVYRFNGAGYLKPGYTHLFVLPIEGGTPRQISSGKFQHSGLAFGASEAVWTPDGKYLLMSANRNQDYEREARDTNVYEFSVTDGSVRALTTRKGPDNSPQISPDGKLIAYVGYEDKYQGYQVTQLHIMNRDGSNQRVISSKWDRDVANARWAGDGSGLYFTSDDQGNTGLYFIMLDGVVRKLLNNVGSGTSAYGGGGGFTIAKNGAFAITQTRPNNPGDIAVGMISEQEELIRGGAQFALHLAVEPGFEHSTKEEAIASLGGAVPPNREILKYRERRSSGEPIQGWYVVEKTPIITGSDFHRAFAVPAQFGDGYDVAFNLNQKAAEKFREWTKANIGGALAIVLNGEVRSASRVKDEIPNGDGIIEGFTKEEAEKLCFRLRYGGAPLATITAVNEDLFADKKLCEVEEIWYQSSKDNRKIQGWIIKPPGFTPSKKYPLILEIHGGPFANYGDRFDLEKQLMAASGYVVLYTNPRGSTSYGGEFGNLIHHAYPGDDFFDLNSGVDAMVAKGYIDPEQLYVTGGSGGGVLTCWMIGRSPRFRAAVTVYPVINWYSFVLTSDIGNWTVNHWFPGFPWDHVEHYEKRSLLSVVKNVKTPTMVLTGEEDWRTPMSDSEQYYQALKLLGVEAALVRVPNEPHGIQVRPSHHMSKILHIIGWIDKHRKPENGAPNN